MKYGFISFNINPNDPSLPAGFITSTKKIKKVKGNLFGRLFVVNYLDKYVSFLSLDTLAISKEIVSDFESIINKKYKGDVICSATHTHYAPSLCNLYSKDDINQSYLKQVKISLNNAIDKLVLEDGELYYGVNSSSFDKVGSSRLSSGNNNNIYVSVLSIFNKEQRIMNFLMYNCHPTISAENADYLSPDLAGYSLELLKQEFSDDNFIYYNGAGGDVSTRFIRKEKSYNEALRLSDILKVKFKDLLIKNKPSNKVKITVNEKVYPINLEIKNIDFDKLNTEKLSEKEKREIDTSKLVLKILNNLKDTLETSMRFISVDFDGYKLIFNPFELFSSYNELIDKNKCYLVNYSLGYCGYLTRSDFHEITYEYIVERLSLDDKKLVERIISGEDEI